MTNRLWIVALAVLASGPALAFEMPPRDAFDATVERPLFFPGRRAGPPASAPPAADAVAVPPVAPAGLRLIGLAVDRKGRAVAVWRSEAPDGGERRAVAGDRIGEWTIDTVGRGGVEASSAGRRVLVPIAGLLPAGPD